MLVRIFLALFLFGVFESIGGTPYKRGPPIVTEEDEPNIVRPPLQVDENDENDDIVVGDMTLKRRHFAKNSKHPREKRMAWSTDFKWPKSGDTVTIPYTSSGINNEVLQRAIEVFNAKTCIRFVQRGSQANYAQFTSGDSCNAAVGYRDEGAQSVELSSSCAEKKGKVLHEMMHVVGFMHEQCRPDRNSYITVNDANIKTGAKANFAIQGESVNQNIPYDCDSILHYKGTYASKNGQPTITSTHCSALGNGDTRLSLLDYKRVNKLYGCDNPTYRYFTVRVITDGSSLTGTDCFIYIKLHGQDLTSKEFELDLDDAGSSNLFESGSDDTFSKMAFRNDLGTITGISIRMVSHGSGPAWWPTSFTVTDPVNNQVKTFTNNNWLSPSSTYGTSSFPLQST